MISSRDQKERKDLILGVVIDRYIKTVTPVSSQFLSEETSLDLSSATIRHILAQLEEEGFLTHPHTSAGRIPTQKGYRYYVDNLMKEIQLLEDEKTRIKTEYKRKTLELEDLLEQTSKIVSRVTNYTSIMSVDGNDNKLIYQGASLLVGYPDYHNNISNIRNILAVLEEKERILEFINKELQDRIEIYIGHEILCSGIDSCSMVISPYKTKTGPSGKIAVIGPTRMNYKKVVSALDYLSHLLNEMF